MSKLIAFKGDLGVGFDFYGPFTDDEMNKYLTSLSDEEVKRVNIAPLNDIPELEPDTATYQYLIHHWFDHDKGRSDWYVGAFTDFDDACQWANEKDIMPNYEILKVET